MNNDLTPYLAEAKKGGKSKEGRQIFFFLVNRELMP